MRHLLMKKRHTLVLPLFVKEFADCKVQLFDVKFSKREMQNLTEPLNMCVGAKAEEGE